jgi:fructose-bisphosphate aldolase class II
MALFSLQDLLRDAHQNRYAIPAFNVSFQEQIRAVLDAAYTTNSPVIIQLSTGGLSHIQDYLFRGMLDEIKNASLPICLHRDHCHTVEHFCQAVSLGFSSVMMDGTLTADGIPRSIEDNISITQKACAIANKSGVSVEAELGCLGSLETGLSGEEDGTEAQGLLSTNQLLTDPQEAAYFVSKTNIHALAIAIGTSHGAYKFSAPPTDAVLDIPRVQAIANAIPHMPLVLHGSSSVPQELLQAINAFGGDIPETYGVPMASIQSAIPYGVAKVNIDTDLRLAATAAVRQCLAQNPSNTDPRNYLHAAYSAMREVCETRYRAFGSAGQATRIMESQNETHPS